jgi:hypothetical protein
MQVDAFQPGDLAQTTCAVTAASAFFAIPGNGECLELYNVGPNICFIETAQGASDAAATVANSYPVGVGQCKIIRRVSGDIGIMAIAAAAGTATLYVTAGNGV